MRNRFLISFLLAAAMLVVACDEAVGPERTGGIVLQFVIPDPPSAAPADSTDVEEVESEDPTRRRGRPDSEADGSGGPEVRVEAESERMVEGGTPNRDEGDSPTTHVPDSKGTRAAAARLGTIETARAFLSGPTDTVVTLTVTTDSITGSIQGLAPGTYTVTVEGLIGGDVDHFGQATGVQVGSGATATATIAFLSFRPDLTGFTLTSTAAFSFNVTFPAVSGATNYDVSWDTDPGFGTSPDSSTASGPAVTVTVGQATTYYVRVRARNTSSNAVGRWSDVRSVDVIAASTGTPAAPTGTLGDTLAQGSADTAVAIDVNVDVPGIQSWFKTPVCMGDTLTFAAVAANLSPPSPLDTYLRIVQSLPGTDTLASNDDGVGTDAEITMVMPEVDSVRIVVGGQNNTVGHFELRIRRAAGMGRSPVGSCLGVVPDRLAIRNISGGTAGTPFTVEVEVRDQFDAPVPAASNQITLSMGVNPGSMLLHISDCCGNPMRFRYVDQAVPTILPDFITPTLSTEMLGATWDPNFDRFFTVGYNEILTLDPVTGVLDTVISGGLATDVRGIAFVNNGTQLIGADRFSNLIVSIDTATGAMAALGAVTGITTTAGFNGLATDPTDGRVYAISKVAGQTRELVYFDAATLAGVTVDTFDVQGMAAIAFGADGRLFGLGGDGSGTHPATLIEIDKFTALNIDGLTGMGTSASNVCCGETMTSVPARLRGTLTQNAVNGVATFSDIEIDATENGYTIQATAMGLNSAESAPFNVTGGMVSNLPIRVDVSPTCCSNIMFPFGDTVRATATFYDADLNTMSLSPVWSSLTTALADVDGSGLITTNSTGATGVVTFLVSDVDGAVTGNPFVFVNPMPVALVTAGTSELGQTLDSFNLYIPGFAFDTINVAFTEPTVAQLQNYAAVLLWTNFGPNNTTLLGDTVEAYAQSGGNVVMATFIWQWGPTAWGALHSIQPLSEVGGSEYVADSLNIAGMAVHQLTSGLSRLAVYFQGGVVLESGATQVAAYTDATPSIAYRVLGGGQRIVGASVFPNAVSYPTTPPATPSGDFYRLWQNALGWAGNGGTLFPSPPPITVAGPALVDPAAHNPSSEVPAALRRPEGGR